MLSFIAERRWQMIPENFPKVLELNLVGRTINLQNVSDDGFEVIGCIIEIKIEGDELTIKTTGARQRDWNDTKLEPYHRNEFSGSLADVEEVEIQPDGTILIISWEGFDYVYILPQP